MRAERLLGWLGVAVAVFCATAVTVTAVAIAMPSVRTRIVGVPKATAPGYRAGERVDISPDLFQAAPSTLVILFDSSCGVCQRVRPMLSKLAARDSQAVRVIGVTGTANRHDAELFLGRIGLKQDRLVTLDLKSLRVATVPTLLLVDRDGTIRMALEGVPSPQAQDDLGRMMLAAATKH